MEIDAEMDDLRRAVQQLVEALETSARAYHNIVHGKGDWRQCDVESCLSDSAALAAGRAWLAAHLEEK